jgi:hypothetical protein
VPDVIIELGNVIADRWEVKVKGAELITNEGGKPELLLELLELLLPWLVVACFKTISVSYAQRKHVGI